MSELPIRTLVGLGKHQHFYFDAIQTQQLSH